MFLYAMTYAHNFCNICISNNVFCDVHSWTALTSCNAHFENVPVYLKLSGKDTTWCQAKFLTSHHVRMQSNIPHFKYAEKTDD